MKFSPSKNPLHFLYKAYQYLEKNPLTKNNVYKAMNDLNHSRFYRLNSEHMAPYVKNDWTVEVLTGDTIDQYYKGDIVALKNPTNTKQQLIRRITAMPGDRLVSSEADKEDLFVPDDCFWVTSDNEKIDKDELLDSRNFGFVKKEDIAGRVVSSVDKQFKYDWLISNNRKAITEDWNRGLYDASLLALFDKVAKNFAAKKDSDGEKEK